MTIKARAGVAHLQTLHAVDASLLVDSDDLLKARYVGRRCLLDLGHSCEISTSETRLITSHTVCYDRFPLVYHCC